MLGTPPVDYRYRSDVRDCGVNPWASQPCAIARADWCAADRRGPSRPARRSRSTAPAERHPQALAQRFPSLGKLEPLIEPEERFFWDGVRGSRMARSARRIRPPLLHHIVGSATAIYYTPSLSSFHSPCSRPGLPNLIVVQPLEDGDHATIRVSLSQCQPDLVTLGLRLPTTPRTCDVRVPLRGGFTRGHCFVARRIRVSRHNSITNTHVVIISRLRITLAPVLDH